MKQKEMRRKGILARNMAKEWMRQNGLKPHYIKFKPHNPNQWEGGIPVPNMSNRQCEAVLQQLLGKVKMRFIPIAEDLESIGGMEKLMKEGKISLMR